MNNSINYDRLRNGYKKKNISTSKLVGNIYNKAHHYKCLNWDRHVYTIIKD